MKIHYGNNNTGLGIALQQVQDSEGMINLFQEDSLQGTKNCWITRRELLAVIKALYHYFIWERFLTKNLYKYTVSRFNTEWVTVW